MEMSRAGDSLFVTLMNLSVYVEAELVSSRYLSGFVWFRPLRLFCGAPSVLGLANDDILYV